MMGNTGSKELGSGLDGVTMCTDDRFCLIDSFPWWMDYLFVFNLVVYIIHIIQTYSYLYC